jgi:hypothetical protein
MYYSFSSSSRTFAPLLGVAFLALLLAVSAPLAFAEEPTVVETDTDVEEVTTEGGPTVDETLQQLDEVLPESSGEGSQSDGSQDDVPPVDGDASIETGDAEGGLDSESESNTNDTMSSEPDGSDITVENDNTALHDTDADVGAETGDNTAAATGDATIETGNATAVANVVNVVNTNIFNSHGLFYFLNLILGNLSFDTRNIFSVLSGEEAPEGGCNLSDECLLDGTSVNIRNTNDATVENDITVTASTGGNTASAGGTASVNTGDAVAAANLVNVVNTNITDSSYLLMTVNGYDPGRSSVIFPGADWFYELLDQGRSVTSNSTMLVNNTNVAEVNNDGEVVADTGNNLAEGDDNDVDTGDAYAAATVVNRVNTNIIGNSLSLLFRVHGDWTGDIFGLPDGMSWRDTGNGVEIFFDGNTTSAGGASTDFLSVENNNTATVNNNVSVYALTGENEATSQNSSASVSTGDATAAATVVNVVNTNVLGRNWVLAIFNIFGDWHGNVQFGQPDLWVGVRALEADKLRRNSCFTYEVTVNNLGDAAASNVALYGLYSPIQQEMERLVEQESGSRRVMIGDIRPGGSVVETIPVCLSSHIPGSKSIMTEFRALSVEPDADLSNNSDSIMLATMPNPGGALRLGPSDLRITKTASVDEIQASSSVEYTIVIKNFGDPVYHALLVDTIYDPDGMPVHEQRWGLDTILMDETIVVSYDAFFNSVSEPGTYTNEAFISGVDRNPNYQQHMGTRTDSPLVSATIEITEGEVLGERACEQLLYTYIAQGSDNNANDVSKLQYFLSTTQGEADVMMTGIYDAETHAAVMRFQETYAADILDPWGIEEPTGYVYYTTQKKVNELWCGDLDFSLDTAQLSEIESFKNRLRAYEEAGVDVPEAELNRVGVTTGDDVKDEEEVTTEETAQAAPKRAIATVAEAAENYEVTSTIWSTVRNQLFSVWSFVGE